MTEGYIKTLAGLGTSVRPEKYWETTPEAARREVNGQTCRYSAAHAMAAFRPRARSTVGRSASCPRAGLR